MKCVNLRGTSGSGKSTIIRELMSRYKTMEKIFVEGRKQPLCYNLFPDEKEGKSPLFIPGHYETPTGGCDTISDGMNFIYDMINQRIDSGFDVAWEGLIVASDVTRCAALKDRTDLLVIELSTPIEECLAGIRSRREVKSALKGVEPKPVDPKNTVAKMKQLKPQRVRFKSMGVDFRYLNREEAMKATLEHFGWAYKGN